MYKTRFLAFQVSLPNLSERIFWLSAVESVPRIYDQLYRFLFVVSIRAKLSLAAISG